MHRLEAAIVFLIECRARRYILYRMPGKPVPTQREIAAMLRICAC